MACSDAGAVGYVDEVERHVSASADVTVLAAMWIVEIGN
jgi:hypothetical protein